MDKKTAKVTKNIINAIFNGICEVGNNEKDIIEIRLETEIGKRNVVIAVISEKLYSKEIG